MGQKVNPIGMRIGLNKDWSSRWYASNKDYSNFLMEDVHIRTYITKTIGQNSFLSHIDIERKKTDKGTSVKISVYVGRLGATRNSYQNNNANQNTENSESTNIKKVIENGLKAIVGENCTLKVDFYDVKNVYLDAQVVSKMMCKDLENRASFRIVQKRALANIRRAGAKGCKTEVSGRLAGAEIARTEGYKDGTMAINTLKSDIDYAWNEAHTTYGKLGVKVWICRGEKTTKDEDKEKLSLNDNHEKSSVKKGE